jgi:hypothetical protein
VNQPVAYRLSFVTMALYREEADLKSIHEVLLAVQARRGITSPIAPGPT